MNKSFLLFLILSTHTTMAQTKSSHALTSEFKNQRFSAQLTKGYHFNEKAPNSILIGQKTIPPTKLESQKIAFKLPTKSARGAMAELYVCDDAITFCETHQISLDSTTSTAKKSLTAKKSSLSLKKDQHGFWQNYEQGLKMAGPKDQLLLLEFSAKWCPGCVRFEKEVFPTREFEMMTRDFVKVKIDVDQFQNFSITEKYNIKGIPAFVVITSAEKEVNRLIDFQELPRIKSFLEELRMDRTPLEELLKKNDSAFNLKIGQRLLAAGRAKESLAYLEKVQPRPNEYWPARIEFAQEEFNKDKENKETYEHSLREAIRSEPKSSRSLNWRTELIKLLQKDSTEAKSLLAEGSKLADDILQDKTLLDTSVANDSLGEFLGYEKMVIGLYKADLIEAAGLDSVQAYSQAADLGKAYHIPADHSGPALRYLIILSAAKRWPEAELQANAILKKDPNNTDVKRRKVKILINQNKFTEAANLGESIINKVEGRNQFWVAELLCRAYLGLKKNDSARRLLTAYLARPEMETEKMKSSKKSFEDLLNSIH